MRLILLLLLLLLCRVAPGAAFVAKVAPSAASKSRLGRHDDGTTNSPSSIISGRRPSGRRPSGRRPLLPHALRLRADDGGGDDTPGESSSEIQALNKKVEVVEEDIKAVRREIGSVGKKIEAVEAALSGGLPYLGTNDRDLLSTEEEHLRKKEEQLFKREEQLRKRKKQLREEKLLLPELPATAMSGHIALADFGDSLTRAVVAGNTLELADGTFFMGAPKLRSKLFIRPCYESLSELILEGVNDGSMKKIVVTGTPGIGKSEFGFYLMYLLRGQGNTVILDRKGFWYRFSDEGVAVGDLSEFRNAGYLYGSSTWYLSDPKDQPMELLGLPTVVLLSPWLSRANHFMNQAGSHRFYMPPWCLDELSGCRQAVFPHVPETDVRERFGKVGGMARAVFDAQKLKQACREISSAAVNMDLNLLQQILPRRPGDIDQVSTVRSSEALLHLLPIPGTGFTEFSVDFASEFAHNVTLRELPIKKFAPLASFVRAAFANDELGAKVAAERAAGFEIVAHKTIGDASEQQWFDMRILSRANSSTESVLEGNGLIRLSFVRERSFEGNSFPDKLGTGTYYRPRSPNFASADSFGVDSGSKILWFFEMKPAGLPPKKGKYAVKWKYVEEHWRSAKLFDGAPIKDRCVYAFVVPEGKTWNKATKTSEKDGYGDWLRNVNDGFKSTCDVCVIEMPL
ncbi:unnamed protein product [Ectocarpus sp. 12 AP-2014]